MSDLNEAFDLWVNDIYHQKKHTSTWQSPFARFTARMECLRVVPQNFKDHFRHHARCRVAKDRTVTLNGKLYEAPIALIGKQVLLLYHNTHPERVEVTYSHESYGLLSPFNLNFNARVKRDKNNGTDL